MSVSAAYYHSPELPWSPALAEERRFRLLSITTLLLVGALGLAAYMLKLPPLERAEVENVPPRLTKLVIQEKPVPPPPPPEPVRAEPEKKPEAVRPEVKKETRPPVQQAQAAREKASRSGLLAMKNELAALQNDTLPSMLGNNKLTQNVERDSTRRSIITSNATSGSGGINVAQLSRDPGAGSTRLAARDTTVVESTLLEQQNKDAPPQNGRKGRSLEQIKWVLDQNKGAIYTLYQRALRTNPALQGKVVLELTIAPSGEITQCKVLSSEVDDEDLMRKLVARVKLFQFGAKAVEATVFTWPIDFLPSM